MVRDALHYNAETLHHYDLHAYVVMPNHIHALLTPAIPLPTLIKSIKNITARRANTFLQRKNTAFWQDETYDHQIRGNKQFTKIHLYIENNPVKAGLVQSPADYRWSTAAIPNRKT
jgi:REP element-mobilizing transposase RayT